MTVMADFLLQPASTERARQVAGRETGRLDGPRPPETGQDFSRLLQTQRQSADTVAPAPARRQNEAAGGAEDKPVSSRQESRKTVDKSGAGNATTPQDKTSRTERQKDGAKVETDTDEQQAGLEEEQEPELVGMPGLLDPLLVRIMQTRSSQPVDETNGLMSRDQNQEQAAGQLLAMIQGTTMPGGSLESTSGKPAAALQAAAVPVDNGQAEAEAIGPEVPAGAEMELDEIASELPLLEEELPLAAQLLASAPAKTERGNEISAQLRSDPIEKAGHAGEQRTDAVLRTEAVQSVQAARQLPGQALNMQQACWSKELTDKVMWMSSQNLKSAEIKLNPAELGRLDIRVQVGQEHTQITFSSAHAGVRDSLDGQMYRLREMLEQQGMHSVDVEVADRQQRQDEQQAGSSIAGAVREDGPEEELVAVSELEQQEQGHAGLVSYYV